LSFSFFAVGTIAVPAPPAVIETPWEEAVGGTAAGAPPSVTVRADAIRAEGIAVAGVDAVPREDVIEEATNEPA
jgi:hypothetical protein